MIDHNAVFEAELYTERLNDMYAVISEFLCQHPNHCYCKTLVEKRKDVSFAHRQSRFYCDKGHFELWEKILSESESLLKEAKKR